MTNQAFVLTQLNTLEKREVPIPKAKAGEIVLRLETVGVCGSDVHYYQKGVIGNFKVEFPFILGHECAGIVVETGEGVTDLKTGDRVALEPGVPCGRCEMCRTGHYNLCPDVQFLATPPYDGCLKRYISFPAEYAFKLPENMSAEQGALVEPMAIGMNAALTGGVKTGDTVVVFGAGCIGLVTMLAAKAAGATKVIVSDVIPLRLEKALELGADAVINSREQDIVAEVKRLTGAGPDVVLDCAGFNDTIRTAVQIAKPAATIVIVGMGTDEINGVPLSPINVKELKITSIFRYKNMYPRTIAAIAEGKIKVDGIVTKRFAFDQTPDAFASAAKDAVSTVKNVINFDD